MLAMSACFVGAPVLLNYLVDPYDRFGNNTTGIFIMAEREMKNTEVERWPHDALLLGNSRIANIPVAPLAGFRFFNGAFPAASAEELYWFIHHHAHRQKVIIIGIDMGTQDPPVLQGDIFRRDDWAAVADNLVNLQTVEYSLKTLISRWSGKRSRYLPDGGMTELEGTKPETQEDALAGKIHLQNLKGAMASRLAGPPWSLSFFRKISDELRVRKIPCVIVMPPIHEEVNGHLKAQHLEGAYQAWVDEMKAIFPNIVNLTSSRYSAAAGFYARDPVHYKPEVGVRFMNEKVVPFMEKVLATQHM